MKKHGKKSGEKNCPKEICGGTVYVGKIAAASLIGLLVTAILSLAAAVLIFCNILPCSTMKFCALFSAFAGGLVSALSSAGRNRRLPCALAAGVLMLVGFILLGMLAFNGCFILKNILSTSAVLLAACMAGSVISSALR